MTFRVWCAVQADRVKWQSESLYQSILRTRILRESHDEQARIRAKFLAQIGPGIARDIREWRTHP
jgi:hypothetical protein